jgi:hypothetical protein
MMHEIPPVSTAPSTLTQNADVRFLGRLLGEVIRTYEGEEMLARIEAIRAASVDRYRGIANPRNPAVGLDSLSLDETVAFVRSFMLFSMLANLAEDRQGVAAEKESTLVSALALLDAQGVTRDAIMELLEVALVAPVLTAHPTEVMRKSMLDHRNRIVALLRLRDGGSSETPDGGGDPAADIPVVADARAAPATALCRRRGRDRARTPARHLPLGRTGAVRTLGTAARAAPGEFPQARQLDRRRS